MGKDIYTLIEKSKKKIGFAEICILPLNSKIRKQIAVNFAATDISAYPNYLKESSEMRADPLKLFPWVRSVITIAFPFNDVPDQKTFLKPATSLQLSGKVAGYAMKKDYHVFGKELLAELAETLKENLDSKIKTEICIDTFPVAEKVIAAFAGLGKIGLNSCLLVKNHGSGCFLGEIFTDFEFTGLEFRMRDVEDSEKFWSCQGCNRCLESCPTGAISDGKEFDCGLCRSHLSMEKRGELTKEEISRMEYWVFGCDICTDFCPRSNLPETFDIDLEWLLMTPSKELKKAVKGTALEYAGVTLLQRNALAVLDNRNSSESFELIKNFAKKTGSDLLQKTAENIIKHHK